VEGDSVADRAASATLVRLRRREKSLRSVRLELDVG
jgi:hypothetical protein